MVPQAEVVLAVLQQTVAQESTAGYQGYSAINSRAYPCSVDGCPNQAYAKRLCNAHYLRKQNGRRLDTPILNRQRAGVCTECQRPTKKNGGWGRCKLHYRRRRGQLLKEVLVQLFGGRCFKCGFVYPSCVFDFHHRGDKKFTIGECLGSLRSLAFEVVKCDLLCANCHRMETHGGLQYSRATYVAA